MILFIYVSAFLLILVTLPIASAHIWSAGYEIVGIYFTYRSSVVAWGVSQKKIFPLLKAGNANRNKEEINGVMIGGGNVNEILTHLKKTTFTDAYVLSKIGDLDNPDPHRLARWLHDEGLTGQYPSNKLFSGGTTQPQVVVKQSSILEQAQSEVEGKQMWGVLDKHVGAIRTSLVEIIKFRQSDLVGVGLRDNLPILFPGAKLETIEQTWPHDPSVKFVFPDIAKTVMNSQTAFKNVGDVKKFTDTVAKWPWGDRATLTDDKPAVHHKLLSFYRHWKVKIDNRCALIVKDPKSLSI